MQIPIQNVEAVTPEKAEWCEQQINRRLEFGYQSSDILRQETQTTLNWLFAILVGCTGYAVTLLSDPDRCLWFLVLPLFTAAAVASSQSLILLRTAMQAVPIPPSGNEPRNLLTDDLFQHDIHWIRLAESAGLQERIERIAKRNREVGDAINRARTTIAVLPFVCAAVAVVTYCIAV